MAGLSVFLHGQAVSFPAWPGCQFPGMAARSFLGCPARLVPWVLAAPFGRAALGRAAGRAVVVALSVRRLLAAPPWPRLAETPRWPGFALLGPGRACRPRRPPLAGRAPCFCLELPRSPTAAPGVLHGSVRSARFSGTAMIALSFDDVSDLFVWCSGIPADEVPQYDVERAYERGFPRTCALSFVCACVFVCVCWRLVWQIQFYCALTHTLNTLSI
jgi:hypothetical protein